MSSREERQGRWDPEAPGASGGHLAPEVAATGPLFDPVTGAVSSAPALDPLPDRWGQEDPAPRSEAPASSRTDVIPSSRPGGEPRSRTSGPVRRRVPIRRVKRTIRHVTPFSVLKLSLFLYGCFLVLWLIAVAILYWIVSSFGFFEALERFNDGMVIWKDVNITLWVVEKWAFLAGIVMFAVGTLANTFLAFLYNFGADTVGGLEVTFVERDA